MIPIFRRYVERNREIDEPMDITTAYRRKSLPEVFMEKAKWMIGLLAITLLMNSCALFEDSKASFKKTFPGRTDNQVKTESNTSK